MNADRVKIAFTSHDGTVETMWAEVLGDDLYRLSNIPFFQCGVSYRDVVNASPADDGLLEFRSMAEKSGHRTIRVNVPPARSGERDELLHGVVALGCTYEGAFKHWLAIDVPPEVSLDSVCDYLAEQGWDWEYTDPTQAQLQHH